MYTPELTEYFTRAQFATSAVDTHQWDGDSCTWCYLDCLDGVDGLPSCDGARILKTGGNRPAHLSGTLYGNRTNTSTGLEHEQERRMGTQEALDQLFDDIAGAGDLDSYERAKDGTHVLVLKDYEIKPDKDDVPFIAVTFRVWASDTMRKGEQADDAWMIKYTGWTGKYAKKRARMFAKAAIGTLGGDPENEETIKKVLNQFADAKQLGRGVPVKCEVRTKTEKDGSPKLSKSGNVIQDRVYSPIEGFSKDKLAEMRKWVETATAEPATPRAQTSAPAPKEVAPPPAEKPAADPFAGLFG